MPLSEPMQFALWSGATLASAWLVWRAGVFSFSSGAKKKGKGKAGSGGNGALSRDVSGLPGAIWFVCAAATFLALPVGASLAAGLPPDVRGAANSLQSAAMTALVAFGLTATVGLVLLYLIQPRTGPNAGARLDLRDVMIGAWCFVLTVPFYALTTSGAQWFWTHALHDPPPKAAHAGLRVFLEDPLSLWGGLFALAAVLLTPIAEELIYRVYAQSSLRAVLGDTPRHAWLSVLIVSVVFAFSHTSGGTVPWAAVPGLLVLSIALGIAYERTRRPGVPMTMHALFNAGNLVLAWWSARGG